MVALELGAAPWLDVPRAVLRVHERREEKVYPVCKVSDAGRAESTGHRTAGGDFDPGPDREGPTRTSLDLPGTSIKR